ncbi:DUF4173 domain-containing protein [Aquihabitans sp. G128]|uniref:DUF4153 domain-containing protein n=1 Tax=Aquihabitans sp. G128 TaxID=2849779 RepID=UPI001C2298F4|nr:DUF4173 domain-containing protein [Aquihabitans sp. G128]QXC59584.1 DUF4173 domain-containing protein [Aquihabitans sp. G128]
MTGTWAATATAPRSATWDAVPPPPGPPPGPPRHARPARPPRAADPAPGRLLALTVGAGIALELGLRGGLANLAVTLGLGLVAAGLATGGRVARRAARRFALGALAPVALLSVVASPWLIAADLGAVAILMALAVITARGGRVTDLSPAQALARLGAVVPAAWSAPRSLAGLVPRPSAASGDRVGRVLRGLLVAVPMLAVVVGLLASADAVFASFVSPDIDPGPATGHLVLGAVLGLAALAVVGAAAASPTDRARHGTFGAVEVVTMLTLAVGVLGLFVLSQLVAATDAGHRLVASSGQTPAEYARSGFFQLCWATAVLLAFLAVTRALATPEAFAGRAVRALAATVPTLGLGLVVVSLRRMALYDLAFGLTMLRLAVVVATLWFASVLVMVALRNAGVADGREWVLAAALASALVLVAAANVARPEAIVVHHNLARARAGTDLDVAYLRSLSADAVGPLLDEAARADDPELRRALLAAAGCDGRDLDGAAALNLSEARAAAQRAERCRIAGGAS